jgi:hypothetical protein
VHHDLVPEGVAVEVRDQGGDGRLESCSGVVRRMDVDGVDGTFSRGQRNCRTAEVRAVLVFVSVSGC